MTFVHRVRVRYGDVDAQGVVFNANWLAYFDDAMTRFFDHLGFDPKQTFLDVDAGFDVMLVKAVVEWRGPAGFDDVVDVEVVPTRLGTSSFDLTFTSRVDGREVVAATITYVSIQPGANRPAPIPADVRRRLGDGRGGAAWD